MLELCICRAVQLLSALKSHDGLGFATALRFSASIAGNGCFFTTSHDLAAISTVVSKLITNRHFLWGKLISITDTELCCQKN